MHNRVGTTIAFDVVIMQTPQGTSHKSHRRSVQSVPRASAVDFDPALDDDREASMADEGGVSAALLDIDDEVERRELHPGVQARVTSSPLPWWVPALAGGALVAGVAMIFSRRSRKR